jgi:DNA-binding winged helix-turn-helix (wHTH) protein
MGATAKSLIPQVMQFSTKLAPLSANLFDSSSRIRIVDLKEMHRLTQFLPVIVLIPKSTLKNQTFPGESASKPKITSTEKNPLGLLDKTFDETVEQLKRTNAESEVAFGEVIINFSEMTACRKGKPVELTTMEFKTLKYLIQHARRVISRDELLNEVWGYENYPCTRTVDNHILRLRQKLEPEPSRPIHFRTVHGAGYKFLP